VVGEPGPGGRWTGEAARLRPPLPGPARQPLRCRGRANRRALARRLVSHTRQVRRSTSRKR
jgi:hypothetical protein